MLNIAIQMVLLWSSLVQATPAVVPRTGTVARQLTEEDVKSLELVLPNDSRPWFLNGDPGQVGNSQYIEVYLTPTTTTPALRRGPVVSVMRRISPPTAWTARPTENYAQVAIPGRKFDDIQDDQDINRPFRVLGSFEDNDIVQIVAALRSNQIPVGQGLNSIQPWPILSMNRESDGTARVRTRGAVMQGQYITLRYGGQTWSVVAVGRWIA